MDKEISRRRFLKEVVVVGSGVAAAFFVGCETADDRPQPIQSPTATRPNRPVSSPGSTPLPNPEPAPTIRPVASPTPTPETIIDPTVPPASEPPAPTAEPTEPPPPPQMEVVTNPENLSTHFSQLKESLASEIQNYQGDVAITVTDLQDRERIAINGNVRHLTGCTINTFVYLAVLEDLQNGKYQLDNDLAYNLVQGIPLSQPRFVVPLLYKLGGSLEGGIDKANELRERIGAKNSVMDHEPLYGNSLSGNNYLTANDADLVLTKLFDRQILNDHWSRYAIDTLTQTNYTVDFIIAAGIPDYAKVAHKIGYHWDPTGWVYNDLGLVIVEGNGQDLAFAVSYFSQYGRNEWSGSDFGKHLTEICWQHFAQKYNLSS